MSKIFRILDNENGNLIYNKREKISLDFDFQYENKLCSGIRNELDGP